MGSLCDVCDRVDASSSYISCVVGMDEFRFFYVFYREGGGFDCGELVADPVDGAVILSQAEVQDEHNIRPKKADKL